MGKTHRGRRANIYGQLTVVFSVFSPPDTDKPTRLYPQGRLIKTTRNTSECPLVGLTCYSVIPLQPEDLRLITSWSTHNPM